MKILYIHHNPVLHAPIEVKYIATFFQCWEILHSGIDKPHWDKDKQHFTDQKANKYLASV
jgi:hypothetical protein